MNKKFEDLEIETGLFARERGKYGSRTYSREEFDAIVKADFHGFAGVNYKYRVKFLEVNGYEVNRENLMDGNLSATTAPPEEG